MLIRIASAEKKLEREGERERDFNEDKKFDRGKNYNYDYRLSFFR